MSKADLIVLSARRRALPPEDMKAFQTYLDNGKPMLAIRTSSHAWDTKGKAPKGWVEWLDFDAKVIGGNYGNHHKVGPITTVRPAGEGDLHPILLGVKLPFTTVASLYKNTPLKSSAKALLTGTIPDQPTEPIAWTNEYKKAKVFYTSLGHKDDFQNPQFQRLFHNASRWLLEMQIADGPPKKVRGPF
jgi:type 1 glutamine amidotransferase